MVVEERFLAGIDGDHRLMTTDDDNPDLPEQQHHH